MPQKKVKGLFSPLCLYKAEIEKEKKHWILIAMFAVTFSRKLLLFNVIAFSGTIDQ